MFSYQPLYTLQLLAAAFSLALLAFVIEAIRRTHLEERYALLWLGAAGALFILSVYRPLVLSAQRDAIRRLTQAVALLEHRVHEQATSAL